MNLPPETWTSILRFACEDDIDLDTDFGLHWSLDRRTVCGRPELKLQYALVSQTFQGMMDHILYKYIWISRSTSAAQLADFFDRRQTGAHAQHVGARTRVLVVNRSWMEKNTIDFENFCTSALRVLCHCQHLKAFSVWFAPVDETWLHYGILSRIHREFRAEAATRIPASVAHFGWQEETRWDGSESGSWLATLLARTQNLRFLVFVMTACKDFDFISRIAPRLGRLTHLHISACMDDLWFIDSWDLPALRNLVLSGDVSWFDDSHVFEYQVRPSLRSLTLIETNEAEEEYIKLARTIAPNLAELDLHLPEFWSNWTEPYRLETLKIRMGRLGARRSDYDSYERFEEELINYFNRLQRAHSPKLRLIILYSWPDRADDLNPRVVDAISSAFEDNETVEWVFEGLDFFEP